MILDAHRAHAPGIVALSGGFWDALPEAIQVLRAEAEGDRGNVLFQVLDALGAGDGYEVIALMEHPGDRELGRGDALLGRESLDPLDELQVVREVLLAEAGLAAAKVGFRQALQVADMTGQEPVPQWGVRHEPDTELAQETQDLGLYVTRPE